MSSHGLRTTYSKGCRCDACRQANTRYAKYLELHGTRLVDATPARQHIEMLRASGVGRRQIARRSGVALSVINRLIGIDKSKPANRIRPETLDAILAIKPFDVAPASLVEGHGVQRRLQGLVAMGWTQTELAKRIDWTVSNFSGLVMGRYPMVTRRTHDLVVEMFEQLQMTRGGSARSEAIAKRNGWLPPLAWDDIDDRDEKPTDWQHRDKRSSEELLEDYLDTFAEHRGSIRGAAERLGISPWALEKALHRARQAGAQVTYTWGKTA